MNSYNTQVELKTMIETHEEQLNELVGNVNPTNDSDVQAQTEQMLEKFTKKIVLSDVSRESKDSFLAAVESLQTVSDEILVKKQLVLAKKDLVGNNLIALAKFPSINIDEKEFKKTELSVNKYV